jgi:co-chaperonin GroES (HSP10)
MTVNTSGITPTEFMCLVKPDQVDEKIGSVFIPDEVKERKQHAASEGVLVAASPVAFGYESWPDNARIPQPGDRVIWRSYAGITVDGDDGAKYRLIPDKEIAAIREAAQ